MVMVDLLCNGFGEVRCAAWGLRQPVKENLICFLNIGLALVRYDHMYLVITEPGKPGCKVIHLHLRPAGAGRTIVDKGATCTKADKADFIH